MTEFVFDGTFDGWKRVARAALARGVCPQEAQWSDARSVQDSLPLATAFALEGEVSAPAFRVPKEFIALAREVSWHRDESRWSLLYRVLWRITHGEPHLLDVTMDSDVSTLQQMAKATRRDVHKMHAFVRFREVATEAGPWFVAWFEPQHHIVEPAAVFFRDRFASMRWSILTPDRCVHWDGKTLEFAAGVTREAAPAEDAMEDVWRAYYGSIFNPARVKIGAMTAEMPQHYWKNLPEAAIIPALLAKSGDRVERMLAASETSKLRADDVRPLVVPRTEDIAVLRDAAVTCRGCPLWKNATCTVFGEGKTGSRILVVGEQPGEQEDRVGRPFVGPAGQLFDRALRAAGIDRGELYVTNAVKHFKWEQRGKRRLHQKPNAREVAACRPWLEAEIRAVKPTLIVCLGGTAAESVLARSVRVLSERGQTFPTEFGVPALVTVHPSSLLRLPAGSDVAAAFEQFTADLRRMSPGSA